jgi:hypothetical protein
VIIIYGPRLGCYRSFILLAIITVITIVNYDRITFIVLAKGLIFANKAGPYLSGALKVSD